MRLIVGISGASGIIYGIRLIQVLNQKNVEVDFVITHSAAKIIETETSIKASYLAKLATRVHDVDNLFSPIASGGFSNQGMVVIPCSMKTLAGIASGYSSNLLLRAADVTLKEKRRLVLVPRETPLNVLQLRNMLDLASVGAVILPAMPAYYHKPQTIEDLVDHIVGKVLDMFGIEHNLYERWKGCANEVNSHIN
jgi:4-hydroxy-3-polyprenylbenzoate decarboxylase